MTIARKTKLSALVVALLMAAAAVLVPVTPAEASSAGAVTVVGTAHLSDGINNTTPDAPGCFGGVGTGFHGTDAAAASPVYGGFTYNNTEVLGNASGNLEFWAGASVTAEVTFDWTRVGANAIIFITGGKDGHEGVGVAAFAPVDVPPANSACHPTRTDKNYDHKTGSDTHAQVVGVGVITP